MKTTLAIQQGCFSFSSFALCLAYGSDMYLTAPRKFLPHLVRSFENFLHAQIQSKLKSSESLSAVKCSYLGVQEQSRTFFSASSFSFTREM